MEEQVDADSTYLTTYLWGSRRFWVGQPSGSKSGIGFLRSSMGCPGSLEAPTNTDRK